jgi:N-acetylmuramic acid 6-phosphate (MurNAc-6-P) etherase
VISDEDLEKALGWLVENATKAAKARATRVYLEEFRKSKKALLMRLSDEKTSAAQETYAYAHPEYLALLEAVRQAVEDDEKFRWLQVAAEARIEAYRTMAANARAQGKV